MERGRTGMLSTVTLLALAAPVAAQQGRAGTIPFESYKLGNGMQVILSPDRSTPVVAVDVWYNVGSRNERPGRTGFAHLFEHMMFQGSANLGKGEHFTLMERAGSANYNGTTNEDRTNYYQALPSNRLNLALWAEADRMRSLAITAENFANQREVVKEERRMRFDNAPYASSFTTALFGAAYNKESCFAYSHDVIGSMEDLNGAQLADVQAFFDAYYAPNNATLSVVGDFDVAATKAMIQQYFGSIASRATPAPVQCERPFSHLPTRQTVRDPNANLPAFIASYGGPIAGDPDVYALDLLAAILSRGESSRLNQRLVKQERAALQAQALYNDRRGPGLFVVLAIANQAVSPARLETLLGDELAKIQRGGVRPDELQKAKNQYRAQTVLARQTAFGRAEALQWHAHHRGDPAAVATEMDRYMAVTAADIQRVAARYLVANNRAVVITEPAPAAASPKN